MMKEIRLIFIAIVSLLAFSCVDEILPEESKAAKDGIVLNVYTCDLETKADPTEKPGEASRNENLILNNRVDVFFFKEATPTAPIRKAVYNVLIENGRVDIPVTFTDVQNIFNGLESNVSTCNVVMVANYSEGSQSAYSGCTTRGDLMSLPLQTAHWSTATQSSFVMVGSADLILLNPKGSTPAKGDVRLKRIASKISFNMTVSSSTSDSGTTWTPNTESMSIYMVYAMRQGVLGGTPTRVPTGVNKVDYRVVDYTTDLNSGYADELLYEYQGRNLIDSGETAERERDGDTEECAVFVAGFKDNGGTVTDSDSPFYSYPATWDYGVATEPYLKLIIPWTTEVSGATRTKYYYYKIPFSINTIESNNWYRIYIDVQILGGEEPVPPVATVTYCITDWEGEVDMSTATTQTEVNVIPAQVVAARYLSVPITEYTLYNTDDLVIPITSSHAVEVVGFDVNTANAYKAAHMVDANYVGTNPRIYNPFYTDDAHLRSDIMIARPDYSVDPPTASTQTITFGNNASGTYGWSVKTDPTGKESVIVHHTINRDLDGDNYDVASYTIRMRIRHADSYGDSYYTDVMVEQRPPIRIYPEANVGGTARYGYAFVNGAQNGSPSSNSAAGSYTSGSQQSRWTYYLGSSPGNLSNSNNKNTNMYIIETSVLPTTGSIANYVLGDPRQMTVFNLRGSKTEFNNNTSAADWSYTAPDWGGASRQLTYYYPVGTDTSFNKVIAPRIRIASSFGSTQPVTYFDAFRRCSSYQESGYPAGRWRVPTKAEIEYIAQLNADGMIPLLLGSASGSTPYWCNSGYMTVEVGRTPSYTQSTTNTTSNWYSTTNVDTYIRCVYDDWYWTESDRAKLPDNKINTFTWGDQERSTVNNAQ